MAIRGRRKELGLSQAELAARAGVSREWISSFEAGKSTVEFGLVIQVLDPLGLRLDLVKSGPSCAPTQSADLDALIENHRRT